MVVFIFLKKNSSCKLKDGNYFFLCLKRYKQKQRKKKRFTNSYCYVLPNYQCAICYCFLHFFLFFSFAFSLFYRNLTANAIWIKRERKNEINWNRNKDGKRWMKENSVKTLGSLLTATAMAATTMAAEAA